MTDLMGGDATFQVVSEEDYKIIISDEFAPTMKYNDLQKGEIDILDSDKYQEAIWEYLYDKDKDDDNEKVISRFVTQTFCPEKIDLSKYDVVGMLTLPGG